MLTSQESEGQQRQQDRRLVHLYARGARTSHARVSGGPPRFVVANTRTRVPSNIRLPALVAHLEREQEEGKRAIHQAQQETSAARARHLVTYRRRHGYQRREQAQHRHELWWHQALPLDGQARGAPEIRHVVLKEAA